MIDLGADIIWGHHPHVLQPVQFYKGKPILYSTGNFTFGTMSSNVDRDTGIFRL
ncbi:MAG: CapA family protein, partial [Clostridia bacterium]|nr:CapA family protein [Clostridia bacterium]